VATDPHKRHILAMLLGAVALIVLGALVGTVVLLSGILSTAATKQHFAVTHRILDLGLQESVGAAANDIHAPPLDSPGMVARGAVCYQQHCAYCHGAPGVAPAPAALGMLPVPTNLTHAVKNHSPEWLYYVTRSGVRMTGMPAWEYRLSDESLWSTIAFVVTLPRLNATTYQTAVNTGGMTECEPRRDPPPPAQAAVLLRQYACHSCHRIEGVIGPRVDTGPPLIDWRRRAYIAGVLPNTRDNLVRWIVDPTSVSPATLMPDLGVPPEHALVMATFLLSQP
jgi:mono/diheme cytochrome c family protein